MIADLVEAAVLARIAEQFARNLNLELQRLHEGDAVAAENADIAAISPADAREAREHVDRWRQQVDPLGDDAPVTIPRDAVPSLLQSAYEEFFLAQDAVLVDPNVQGLASTAVPATAQLLDADARDFLMGERDHLAGRWLTKYGERDARFLIWGAAAKIASWAHGGRRPFNDQPPTVPMSNRARVLLVGDWGSGVPRARQLAAVMRTAVEAAAREGRQCHVIHLGDVYYTGQDGEYDRRFLAHWPVKASEAGVVGSWCLNGNHDMYSGGYGYFDRLLADVRFVAQDRCSFFALENDHWQILGLDSAYDDADLYGGQASWVTQMRDSAKQKKGLLLSHHQLFSAWEHESPQLAARLAPVLQKEQVLAWFWGHEHRCALYDRRANIKYPRVTGHGGVPVWAARAPTPAGVTYEYRESFRAFINEKFARFGYVQLDFDDAQIAATYVNELGQAHHHEVMV